MLTCFASSSPDTLLLGSAMVLLATPPPSAPAECYWGTHACSLLSPALLVQHTEMGSALPPLSYHWLCWTAVGANAHYQFALANDERGSRESLNSRAHLLVKIGLRYTVYLGGSVGELHAESLLPYCIECSKAKQIFCIYNHFKYPGALKSCSTQIKEIYF